MELGACGGGYLDGSLDAPLDGGTVEMMGCCRWWGGVRLGSVVAAAEEGAGWCCWGEGGFGD